MSEQTAAELKLAKAELQLAEAEAKLSKAEAKVSEMAAQKNDAENMFVGMFLLTAFITSIYCYVKYMHPFMREWFASLVTLYEKVMAIYQWLVWSGAV